MNARRGRAKRLGQNFLVDRNAVRRIIAALDPRPGDAVLEIGPGRGALTSGLIDASGRIAAVELDDTLSSELSRRFDEDRLLLIPADILTVDLSEVASRLGASPGVGLAVAGNLPYSVSKPIVKRLVQQRTAVDRAVLMFQREVALRLTAQPGTKDYAPLTVLAGLAFTIEKVFDLGPEAFRPRPKVSSSVTLWRRLRQSPLAALGSRLEAALAAAFAHRRQTLRRNLQAALGSRERAVELLEAADLDGSLRAEAVSPEGFVRLASLWVE